MSQGDRLSDPPGPDSDIDVTCAKPTSLKHTSECSTRHESPAAESHSSFKPFILKGHPFLNPDIHFYIHPEILIPRASLPLYFLDCTEDHASLPRQPFSACIEQLEGRNLDQSTQDGYDILVVRLDGYDALHAVERIYEGVYTICKLQSWVTISHLSKPWLRRIKHSWGGKQLQHHTGHWWDNALLGGSSQRPRKRRRLLDTKEPEPVQKVADQSLVETGGPGLHLQSVEIQSPSDSSVAQTPVISQEDVPAIVEDVLANVVQQYLETLYLSKAPLTYFAKGALSRARARVPPDSVHNAQYTQALATSLRSIISNNNTIDKKYKETLPTVIKACNQAELMMGNSELVKQPSQRKKRKSKKAKLGKDGLLPNEDEQVSKWWALDDSKLATISSATDLDNLIKRQLALLRFRDNLMQMILALEVLALENAAEAATTFDGGTKPDLEMQNRHHDTQRKSAPRKSQDLKLYLDLLLDRLCIWQSTATSYSPEEKKDTTEQDATIGKPSEKEDSKDHLKDFCINVIIPFYGGRLSSIVEGLARTLGVKMGPSPSKGPQLRAVRKPNNPAPGTEVQRTLPSNTRRQVKQVATHVEKPSKAFPAALSRSSTDPLLQSIKRERSSTPQLPLTLKAEKRSFSRTNSISQSRSFNQREVDFSAINKYNETKSKRKTKVEEELKEAIATLKKPNRVSAVKDYFNEREQRTTTSQVKPGTKIQRKSTLNVQVGATPKKGSKMFNEPQDTVVAVAFPKNMEDQAIPSTDPNIPGSVLRLQTLQVAPDSTTGPRVRDPRPNMAFETPSKPSRFYKPSSRLGESFNPDSSPAHACSQERPNIDESPFPARHALRDSSKINFSKTFLTPAKQMSGPLFDHKGISGVAPMQISNVTGRPADAKDSASEQQVSLSSRGVEPSIYETLGWTEDDLDELF